MDHAAHLGHIFVVIDFEALTPAGRPAVPIEVAALALTSKGEGLVEVWRFQSLMRPPADVPVTDFNVRQTGITPAMPAGAAEPEDVMARLDAMPAAPPYRLVAHHAATETNLIAHQRARCPALAAVPLPDTVRLARLAYPELTSHALDEVLRFLRIPLPADGHRAMPDVEVTAQVLRRILTEDAAARRWPTMHDLDVAAGIPPKRLCVVEGGQEPLF